MRGIACVALCLVACTTDAQGPPPALCANGGTSAGLVGSSQQAVINGAFDPSDDFRFTDGELNAIAYLQISSPEMSAVCSGVLINEAWLATARHCFRRDGRVVVEAEHVQVCFGRDVADGSCTTGNVPVRDIQWRLDSDLALVQLAGRPTDFLLPGHRDEPIRPVGIPSRPPRLEAGTPLMAAGRGIQHPDGSGPTGELRFSREIVLGVNWQKAELSVSGAVTGGATAHGLCGGDSGGPIFAADRSGRPHLVGVLWRGPTRTCIAKEGQPDVFTLLHPFLCWVRDVAGDVAQPDLDCDEARFEPYCHRGDLVVCQDGQQSRVLCPVGETCGWMEGGFRCGRREDDACDGVDSFGACDDDHALARCVGGTVERTSCAADGGYCFTDETGYARCTTD